MENDDLVKKTIRLYSGSGWKSLFARIRFWDAPYMQVERIVPKKGVIVDLGCGEGLFSNYLALSSKKRKIFGIELSKSRLSYAYHRLSNTHFVLGDINKVNIPSADVIILLHVLHHLNSFKSQEKLLKVCKSKLRKKGKLIIVEIEQDFSPKYFLTSLVDRFLVAWLFERKLHSPIHFRKKNEWIALLNKMGFKVKSCPAAKGKPFPHVIFECINN